MHQVTLVYSISLIRKAVFGYWWRTIWPKIIIGEFIVVGCLAILIYYGDYSWRMGMLAGALFFVTLMIVMILLLHYRISLARFKKMGSTEANFTATEDNFTISSGAGSASLPWSAIEYVWRFPDFYLLFYSKGQYSILPIANINKDTQEFIIKNIQKAGGKID